MNHDSHNTASANENILNSSKPNHPEETSPHHQPTSPPAHAFQQALGGPQLECRYEQDWGEPPAVIKPILSRLLPPWRSPNASWRIADPDDPVSLAAKSVNSLTVFIAFLTQPRWADHIEDHTSRISARTGLSAWKAEQFSEVGLVLQRFPRLTAIALDGLLNFQLVQRMCEHLSIVDPAKDELIDHALVRLLQPTVPNQAMRTTKWVDETLTQLIDFLDPLARPLPEDDNFGDETREQDNGENPNSDDLDPDGPALDDGVRGFSYDNRNPDYTTFTLTVDALTGVELLKAIKNAALTNGVTQGDALLGLIRGSTTANITLNLYKNTHGLPLDEVFGEGHWLTKAASPAWLDRVTHLAGAGASGNGGYKPSEQTAAMVAGRDGHCRFPGCTVPAHRCEIDHVHRYDHDDPESSGPTSTENLHLLCPKHHRLKTAGSWDVTLHPDAAETWTSHGDGHTVITTADGPLGRQTFQHKAVKRIRVAHAYNQQRLDNIQAAKEEQARRQREGLDDPPF